MGSQLQLPHQKKNAVKAMRTFVFIGRHANRWKQPICLQYQSMNIRNNVLLLQTPTPAGSPIGFIQNDIGHLANN
jgi:hypothetical protein